VHPTGKNRVFLAKSSSRYCQNKGSEHNNVTVYFYVTRKSIRQKCFCTCQVRRQPNDEFCKNFKSAAVPLQQEFSDILFGPEDKLPSDTMRADPSEWFHQTAQWFNTSRREAKEQERGVYGHRE